MNRNSKLKALRLEGTFLSEGCLGFSYSTTDKQQLINLGMNTFSQVHLSQQEWQAADWRQWGEMLTKSLIHNPLSSCTKPHSAWTSVLRQPRQVFSQGIERWRSSFFFSWKFLSNLVPEFLMRNVTLVYFVGSSFPWKLQRMVRKLGSGVPDLVQSLTLSSLNCVTWSKLFHIWELHFFSLENENDNCSSSLSFVIRKYLMSAKYYSLENNQEISLPLRSI